MAQLLADLEELRRFEAQMAQAGTPVLFFAYRDPPIRKPVSTPTRKSKPAPYRSVMESFPPPAEWEPEPPDPLLQGPSTIGLSASERRRRNRERIAAQQRDPAPPLEVNNGLPGEWCYGTLAAPPTIRYAIERDGWRRALMPSDSLWHPDYRLTNSEAARRRWALRDAAPAIIRDKEALCLP